MTDDARHEYNEAVIEAMAEELTNAHRVALSRSARLIVRLRHAANVIRKQRSALYDAKTLASAYAAELDTMGAAVTMLHGRLALYDALATEAARIQKQYVRFLDPDDMQRLVDRLAELAPKATDG